MDSDTRDPAAQLLDPRSTTEDDLLQQVEERTQRRDFRGHSDQEEAPDHSEEIVIAEHRPPEPEIDEFGMRDDLGDDLSEEVIGELRFRNRVMVRYGKAVETGIEDFVGGVRLVASMTADYTPVVGDLKGIVETFTGKDLLTGERLGFTSRLLGLICLTELRRVKDGVVSSGIVRRATDYVSGRRIRRLAGKADNFDPITRSLTSKRRVKSAIKTDMKRQRLAENRQRLARNRKRGARTEEAMGKPLEDIARKERGILHRHVRVPEGRTWVEYDYVLEVRKMTYVFEIKATIWRSKSYSSRSGMQSLLGSLEKQITRHKNVLPSGGVYQLVFRIRPSKEWQKQMILTWAEKLGIIVSFKTIQFP